MEELMHRQQRTPEEDQLYELLIFLIGNFEKSFYLQESTTPHSMLLFLMEQQGVNKKDIARILGSDKIASSYQEAEKALNGLRDDGFAMNEV